MSKYSRKKQIKTNDEFVSFWERLFERARPYGRAIGITGLTAFVVVLAAWGITSRLAQRSQDGTEAWGRIVKTYEAELLTDAAPAKTDEADPIPRFKTERERGEATLGQLDAFAQKYGTSDLSHEALLFRAGVLYDLGRYDEATTAYTKFLDSPRSPALSALAREGLGLCHEARGQLDEALRAYRELEPKTGDFYRDRALFAQARVLTKKGDKPLARKAYKELLTKLPTSTLRDDVQARLALLGAP